MNKENSIANLENSFSSNKERKHNTGQEGAALIAVLCILSLMSLLTASAVAISQLSDNYSKVVSDRILSAYWAEGAGARLLWLLIHDRKKYPDRGLGELDNEVLQEEERFLADGRKHKFKLYGGEVEASIFDMANGIDISGSDPSKNLKRKEEEFEEKDEEDGEGGTYQDYLAFMDSLIDYTDSDDFVRLNGLEKNGYEELGLEPLPRNNKLQFREEILLVPGTENFFKPDEYGRISTFQIIPLPGLRKPAAKKSFFSVDKQQLMRDCKLTSEQADIVLAAKNRWQNEKGSLREILGESLLPEVYSTLKGKYSFKESGYYTIIVKVMPEGGQGSRFFTFSQELSSTPGVNGKIYYYDWLMY